MTLSFEIEPFSTPRDLLADWATLYSASEEPSFFLSPHWIDAWLSGRPQEIDLFVLRGKERGQTQALGVVGRSRRRSPPLLGARGLCFNEFGKPAYDAVYIEYNDLLVSGAAPKSARVDGMTVLFEAFPSDDDIVFRNVRSDLAMAVECANADRRNLRYLSRQPTFQIGLGVGGEDEFLATLSSSARSQLRRSIRRYEERGAVTFNVAQNSTEREEVWKKLAYLHENTWRQRAEAGAFSNPQFERFHQRLRSQSPECVHLVDVRAGDETIGCLYNFVHAGRVMNYQSGFRFEADNQLKPGFVAHTLAVRHYAKAGFSSYDLLAGDAPYKRRLAKEGENLSTIVLERKNSARGIARGVARRLKSAFQPAARTRQT